MRDWDARAWEGGPAPRHRPPVSTPDQRAPVGGSLADAIRGLQRTAGNTAVRSLLQRREEDPARGAGSSANAAAQPAGRGLLPVVQRKPDVPGMSTSSEASAKALLGGSAVDKQKAVDIVFAELRRKGRVPVPVAKLVGKKVHYDASVAGEGLTSTNYDAAGEPVSCKVAMGDDAFSSLPWLYSSIIHELEHADQRLAVNLSNLASSAMRETESYALEILKAHQSGVITDKAKMEDLWTRLHDNHWVNIADAKEKKSVTAKVKKAHKIAEKATGKTLTFTP